MREFLPVTRLAAALIFFGYGLDSFIAEGGTEAFAYLLGSLHFLVCAYFLHSYVFSWLKSESFEEDILDDD